MEAARTQCRVPGSMETLGSKTSPGLARSYSLSPPHTLCVFNTKEGTTRRFKVLCEPSLLLPAHAPLLWKSP